VQQFRLPHEAAMRACRSPTYEPSVAFWVQRLRGRTQAAPPAAPPPISSGAVYLALFLCIEVVTMAPVPELAAKKAKREEAWAAQKAADATEARAKAKETRRVIFKKAAQYVNEYRQQVRWQRARDGRSGPPCAQ
jgi:hypothetical protein